MTAIVPKIRDGGQGLSGDISGVAPFAEWASLADFVFVSIRNGTYQWTESVTTPGEFFLELAGGGDPGLAGLGGEVRVYHGGHLIPEGTLGSLATPTLQGAPSGQFAIGCEDNPSWSSITVKFAGGDPDGLDVNGVYYAYANTAFEWNGATTRDAYHGYDWGDAEGIDDHDGRGFVDAHVFGERLTNLGDGWTQDGNEWYKDTGVPEGTNHLLYWYCDFAGRVSGPKLTRGVAGSLAAGEFDIVGTTRYVRLPGDVSPVGRSLGEASRYTTTLTLTSTNDDGEEGTDTRTVIVDPDDRLKYFCNADTGNDSTGDGSYDAPFKTLSALSKYDPGSGALRDTADVEFLLMRGVSADYDIGSDLYVSLRADGQRVRQHGSGALGVLYKGSSGGSLIRIIGASDVMLMDPVFRGSGNTAQTFVTVTSEDGTHSHVLWNPKVVADASGERAGSLVQWGTQANRVYVANPVCDNESGPLYKYLHYYTVGAGGQPVHPCSMMVHVGGSNPYGCETEAHIRMLANYATVTDNAHTNPSPNQGSTFYKSGARVMGGHHIWIAGSDFINCSVSISPASDSSIVRDFVFERNLILNDGTGTPSGGLDIAESYQAYDGVVRNNIVDNRAITSTDSTGLSQRTADYGGLIDGVQFLGNTFIFAAAEGVTLAVTQNAAGEVTSLDWRGNLTVNPNSTADAVAADSDKYLALDKATDDGADFFARFENNILPPMAGRTGTSFAPDHVAYLADNTPAYLSIDDLETATGGSGNEEKAVVIPAGGYTPQTTLTPYTRPVGLRYDYFGNERGSTTVPGAVGTYAPAAGEDSVSMSATISDAGTLSIIVASDRALTAIEVSGDGPGGQTFALTKADFGTGIGTPGGPIYYEYQAGVSARGVYEFALDSAEDELANELANGITAAARFGLSGYRSRAGFRARRRGA